MQCCLILLKAQVHVVCMSACWVVSGGADRPTEQLDGIRERYTPFQAQSWDSCRVLRASRTGRRMAACTLSLRADVVVLLAGLWGW